MKTNVAMAMAVLVLLSACGGSGNVSMVPTTPPSGPAPAPGTPSQPGTPTQPVKPAPTVDALKARLGDAVRARDKVLNLPETRVANVPTSGSTVFSGPALMKVSKGPVTYQMVGDSRLAVNFGSHQMGGKIANFQGQRSNGKTFSAGGEIDYDTGSFSAGRNVFGVDYNGTLFVGGDRIAIDGTAVGGFSGNPSGGGTSAIRAVDGTPGTDIVRGGLSNMTVRLNGQPAVGEILIIGQN